ncbi:MAG: cytidine deaminase [Holophagae bacterium]
MRVGRTDTLSNRDKMKRMNEQQIDELVAAAENARANAYAPYSGFAVGAAVMTDDGRVFVGCNVENASYGLGVCAERHAVGAAVAAGCRTFVGLAVVTAASPPAAPCGACRQVLAEFGDFPVVLANSDNVRKTTSVGRLLPSAFDRDTLDRAREAVRRGGS